MGILGELVACYVRDWTRGAMWGVVLFTNAEESGS